MLIVPLSRSPFPMSGTAPIRQDDPSPPAHGEVRRPPHGAYMTLVHIALHHGVTAAAQQIAHDLGLGDRHPEAEDLVRAARALGLKARTVRRPDARRLSTVPTPAMVRLRDGTWRLLGVETSPGMRRVVDPVSRRERQVPLEEVAADLDGDVVLVGRSSKAEAATLRFGLSWFVPVVKRHWRPLAHVLWLSLFINVLGLATPLVFQLVVDKVLVSKSQSTLVVVIAAMGLISVFTVVLGLIRTYALSHTSSRIDVELGSKLYAHLVRLPISYFERRQAGVVVTRVREVEGVRRFLTDQGLSSAVDILFVGVYLAVMALYSPSLTMGVIALVPIYVAIGVFVRPVFRRLLTEKTRRMARSQQLVVETVVGIQTVKASAIEPLMTRQWDERLASYARASFDSAMVGAYAQAGIQFTTKLSTMVVLLFGTEQVISGSMTVGGLIAFSMIAQRTTQPILQAARLYQGFQEAQVSITHLAEILDEPTEEHRGAPTSLPPASGAITFQDVTFRYQPNLKPAVRGMSLEIRAGEVIGLVGPSGSGKSTLTKLVQRFHEPDSGRILLDGHDLSTVDPAWLRRQLGVVLQENFLFNQTVHGNVAIARPDMSREHVVRMARLAGADEFVSRLPQGYDTMIEERGANLSGGQRQRIAIARALATDPRILILDEATSALDYESERIIRDNMRRIAQGRTVIVIAHRLAAVRDCDWIVGMADGEVRELGSHDELLARERGLYKKLWHLQSEGSRA